MGRLVAIKRGTYRGQRGEVGPAGPSNDKAFYTSDYAPAYPADGTEGLQECFDTAAAYPGGGRVVVDGQHGWTGDLKHKGGMSVQGTGIPKYPGVEAVEGQLIALDNTARYRYGQTGDGSGSSNDNPGPIRDLVINGNYVADELFRMECIDGYVENCHIIRAAPGGKCVEGGASQNSTLMMCHFGYATGGTAVSLYKNPGPGAGSLRFVNCYFATSAMLFTADADPANFQPHDVSFTHCLFEDRAGGNNLIHLKAGEFQFRTCIITNSDGLANPTNNCLVLIENDTWPTVSTIATFDACYFNGGGGDDVDDLIRVKNGNTATHAANRVTVYGRTRFSNGNNIFCVDGGGLLGSAIIQVFGDVYRASGTLNWWRALGDGQFTNINVSTPQPMLLEAPVDASGTQRYPLTFRVEGDTADRIRFDPAGSSGPTIWFFDGITAATPRGSIFYDTGAGVMRIGRTWQVANAWALKTGAVSVTTAAQAVALSGAGTATPAYDLAFGANNASANVSISGGVAGSIIEVTLDNTSSRTGVSVTWPAQMVNGPQPIKGLAIVARFTCIDGTNWYCAGRSPLDSTVLGHAERNADGTQTIATDAADTSTKILWATSSVAERGGLSYSSGTWTVTHPGRYSGTAYVEFDANATGRRGLRWYKNGAAGTLLAAARLQTTASGVWRNTLAFGPVDLVAGDTLEAHAWQDSGANRTIAATSRAVVTNLGR